MSPRVVDPRLSSATLSGSGGGGVEGGREAGARRSDGGQVGRADRKRGRVGSADTLRHPDRPLGSGGIVEGGVELAIGCDFSDECHGFRPFRPGLNLGYKSLFP